MKRTLPLVLLCLVWALPGRAEDVPAEDVANLVAAIEAKGCVVHEANNLDVLKAAGLTEDQAAAVVDQLIGDGKAAFVEDHLELKTGACP